MDPDHPEPAVDRDAIVHRLADQFPEVPLDVLRHEVEAAELHYVDARVAAFLPVLIQREVRERLRRPVVTEAQPEAV
jgi:hypothetical protein